MIPTPMVLTLWGEAVSHVLTASVRLGVFDRLEQGKATSIEVAEACGCDRKGMEVLLDALTGFGYIERSRGLYFNSKPASKWFVSSSPVSLRDPLLFIHELREVIGSLEVGVKTGRTFDLHHEDRPPEFWELYMRSMLTFARFTSGEIVRKVPVRRHPKRLLDVGGGPGAYAATFCRRYPGLDATVLDLPEAVAQGRRIVAEQGMEERIGFRLGDLREIDWGAGFDIVLLFNVIHILPVDDAKRAIDKAAKALNPGGTLAILDSEYKEQDEISTAAGFNKLFFYLACGTLIYPEKTIRGWMTDAGFSNVRLKRPLRVPMGVLITGIR